MKCEHDWREILIFPKECAMEMDYECDCRGPPRLFPIKLVSSGANDSKEV